MVMTPGLKANMPRTGKYPMFGSEGVGLGKPIAFVGTLLKIMSPMEMRGEGTHSVRVIRPSGHCAILEMLSCCVSRCSHCGHMIVLLPVSTRQAICLPDQDAFA